MQLIENKLDAHVIAISHKNFMQYSCAHLRCIVIQLNQNHHASFIKFSSGQCLLTSVRGQSWSGLRLLAMYKTAKRK